MGKAVLAQPLRHVVILTQFVLVGWFVAFGLCCLEDVHPGKCTCEPFGHTRIRVTCTGIKQVPRDLPSNTIQLILSANHLRSIEEDAFRNLTLLKAIDLSRNSLKSIPQNTFRNLNLLQYINLAENNIKGGFYLPGNASKVELQHNRISLNDLKIILKESKDFNFLDISGNPIGPNLTSDTFAGFHKMVHLNMGGCGLQHIESRSFRAMNKLREINLVSNMLSRIEPGTFEGLSEDLLVLSLQNNGLTTIADGTFRRFRNLAQLRLDNNNLTTVPDLTGLTVMIYLGLLYNQFKDISRLGNSSIKELFAISLWDNQIEELPVNIFQNVPVTFSLDLSKNKLTSIPDNAFSACKNLTQLMLSFNLISQINNRTFAGLKNLRILMIMNNHLSIIPGNIFAGCPKLEMLFLHGNRIKRIDGNAFRGLSRLETLTLFDNPLQLLPVKIFDEMSSNVTLAISCKNFQKLLPGMYTTFMECAPSASFHITLYDEEFRFLANHLINSGFICSKCGTSIPKPHYSCNVCRFRMPGTYSNRFSSCLKCPAGNCEEFSDILITFYA